VNNARLRELAAQTVVIVERGGYSAPSGGWVDLTAGRDEAVAGTRLYLPDDALPAAGPGAAPAVTVTNETTLAAGRRLGPTAAALVFASARNPGGGFLRGAKAQEEDIARASALHACLAAVPEFYAYHRGHADLRYTDRVIYSPGVPVFRDDANRLLDEAYQLSFITAAAPNLGAILDNQPDRADSVPDAVRARAVRVLRVAAAHGHRRLVLGAWGCGVFRNDPAVVAGAFADAVRAVGAFDEVCFAVLDRAADTPTYRAFADTFRSE
jgi:uncharacterized protein (TIGR02452 family)